MRYDDAVHAYHEATTDLDRLRAALDARAAADASMRETASGWHHTGVSWNNSANAWHAVADELQGRLGLQTMGDLWRALPERAPQYWRDQQEYWRQQDEAPAT